MSSRLSSFDSWPKDIPRLFPNLNEKELYGFMSEQRYKEICQFPIISIYPPCNTGDDKDIVFTAIGLSRVLIRNLMLAPNLSVMVPEDTSLTPYNHLKNNTIPKGHDYIITGKLYFRDGFVVESEVFTSKERLQFNIQDKNLRSFILKYSELLVSKLGGTITNSLKKQWQYGQPESLEQLTTYGAIVLANEGSSDNNRNDPTILNMFQSFPQFVLPLHQLSENAKNKRQLYLKGIESDPFDADLYYLFFCDIWESKGSQPEAFQFIRKTIELSPGHGKAHMFAPCTARWEISMLQHSELGYRLLPGNPFAVNNYVLNLQLAGETPKTLIPFVLEGIENGPFDPGNYDRIIEIYIELKQYSKALEYALKLRELYGPPIHERTLYCLNQNSARKALLESGKYDPAQENNERISELQIIAVNNYITYLQRTGETPGTLIHLALEGIMNDPYEPTNYDKIIDVYTKLAQYSEALKYALKLQKLYGPPIHERTLYCLNQNLARKTLLESDKYDPAQENNERITKLQFMVSAGLEANYNEQRKNAITEKLWFWIGILSLLYPFIDYYLIGLLF